jgi:ATP-dependent DNA ligase
VAGMYAFLLRTKADKVPTGRDWLREIKHDGYRMMVIREQNRVRLISRGGYDWAHRFPLIVSAALKLRQKSFALDGEVVVLDKDGVSDFDALASRKQDKRAMLYAFDMLATVRTSVRKHSCCERPNSRGCSNAAWMESSLPSTNRATSATSYSASRASWA